MVLSPSVKSSFTEGLLFYGHTEIVRWEKEIVDIWEIKGIKTYLLWYWIHKVDENFKSFVRELNLPPPTLTSTWRLKTTYRFVSRPLIQNYPATQNARNLKHENGDNSYVITQWLYLTFTYFLSLNNFWNLFPF